MEETRQAPQALQSFEFSGNGFEYFRIWIVNLALTIVTLGIYSAWAKVRRLRYFYGHTQLDGHAFDYLADPGKILKGRLIAVALLVIYSLSTSLLPDLALYVLVVAVLLVPLVIVTSSAFAMRNSTYRNVRFGFSGTIGGAYSALLPPLGVLLLIVAGLYYAIDTSGMADPETGEPIARADLLPTWLMLGLLPLLPWLDFLRMRFVLGNTRFGNRHANFGAGLGDFYKLYLGALLMFVVGAIVLMFIVGMAGAFVGMTAPATNAEGEAAGPSPLLLVTMVVAMYGVLFTVGAWFAAQRGNLLRNSTRFGANRLQGELRTGDLVKLYLGNLVMIIVTCGLFIPFASVRLHRYNAQHTAADTWGLDEVVAVSAQEQSALGEEIGEVFDVDIGL